MIELSLAEIADIVGGRPHDAGARRVTSGVEFDNREIEPGGLFVALPGERVDGHSFAAAAVRAGAAGVLAGREVDAPAVIAPPVEQGAGPGTELALAGDTDGSGRAVLAALGTLARHVAGTLAAEGLRIVGVTGSSGKTSAKDLIAALLEPLGPTVAPPGSFNNELGHPWTVLRADTHTRHLVLELSARGTGHIAALAELAPPDIGVVLNVGTAHIGEFGSREAIAAAKGELVESLPDSGVAVLNLDDPLVAAMRARTGARVLGFGTGPEADIRAREVTLDSHAKASFELVTPSGAAPVRLALHGEHNVGNALAAAAVAHELGCSADDIAARLGGAQPRSKGRMAVRTRADGVRVLDDSYNANPESMRAGLKALASMGRGTRSWAVLGELGELGADSVGAHDEIGRLAVRLNIDKLVVVASSDSDAVAMHTGASHEGSWGEESALVPDIDAAITLLREQLRPGDVVLVKASNAAGLGRLADAIVEDAGPAAETVADGDRL